MPSIFMSTKPKPEFMNLAKEFHYAYQIAEKKINKYESIGGWNTLSENDKRVIAVALQDLSVCGLIEIKI
jgi:hypothetical protein